MLFFALYRNLFLLLFWISFSVQAENSIIITQKPIGGGGVQTEIKGSISGDVLIDVDTTSEGASSDRHVTTTGFTVVGGAPAKMIQSEKLRASVPKKARTLKILQGTGGPLIGGMWEVSPLIFVTARHVLQGLQYEWLESAFRNFEGHPLELTQYSFLEFTRYDAVLAIPSHQLIDLRSQRLDRSQLSGLIGSFQTELSSRLRAFVDPMGSVSDVSGNGAVDSSALKDISGVGDRYLYLKADGVPITPGASGALVYTTLPKATGSYHSSDWLKTGIIQCNTKNKINLRGVRIPPSTRVIPFVKLLSASVKKIELTDLLKEKSDWNRNDVPDCGKVDRRGAGG